MVQTNYVRAGDGRTMLGTVWDLCSTDNYIQHKVARKLGLEGDDVELTVGVIKGIEHTEMTKLYRVPIMDLRGNVHIIECYGFDVQLFHQRKKVIARSVRSLVSNLIKLRNPLR